jgi:hypothetical protein
MKPVPQYHDALWIQKHRNRVVRRRRKAKDMVDAQKAALGK